MSVIYHMPALLLSACLFFSCAQAPELAPVPPIESSWPCFNGCSIVLQGGQYGLVSDDGEEVLPPVYDVIEFLDSEVALLSQKGEYSLCTRQGRILKTGESEETFRATWPSILEEVQEADRRTWEEVLQNYELLCRRCKASRGKRLTRKEFGALKMLQDKVMASLQQATGVPTASQKARLEALSTEYRRAF